MRYWLYDLYRTTTSPINSCLKLGHQFSLHDKNPISNTFQGRITTAFFESWTRILKEYPKPEFNYDDIVIGKNSHPITETIVAEKPFCLLRSFRREGLPEDAPKILFIAPISGHHASLARKAYYEFIADHEVYVTDWLNVRDVPLSEGSFGLDDYIDYMLDFLKIIPGHCHCIGISQSTIPTLVGVAHMSLHNHPDRPKTMTLIAGPVDTTVGKQPFSFLFKPSLRIGKKILLSKVPSRYPGAGRVVYPGVTQWVNFTTMGALNYISKHLAFFLDVALGDEEKA